MSSYSPKVSLIISVYDNVKYLKFVLDSLKFQTFKQFEVIVSEDAEHLHMREFISNYQASFPIFHLTQPDEGWKKNVALNRSAIFAHTDYLIFIDGDCALHPRFIEFHIKLSDPDFIVAGKRIKLDSPSTQWLMENEGNILHFQSYLIRNYLCMRKNGALFMEEGFFFNPQKPLGIIPRLRTMRYLKGCNMSFYKDALLAINGFDEDYIMPAVGEDADLAWRFRLAGYQLKSARNLAVQYHLHHKESWTKQDVNLAMMKEKQAANQYVCKNGIKKL